MTKLTFLGSGTSQGVPIIGCDCAVCSSTDKKNKRYRSSALVEYQGLDILIDAGPDFRSQMLEAKVKHLDAILLTHNHKDHTGGLDDVRALNYIDKTKMEIYCEPKVLHTLQEEYDYAFAKVKYPGSPEWRINLISEEPFRIHSTRGIGTLEWVHDVGYMVRLSDGRLIPSDTAVRNAERPSGSPVFGQSADIIPIRGYHSKMPVLGFRFGKIAYITDMSRIPDCEFEKLKGLEHVSLNTVGYKPHHSHFCLDEVLQIADRIGARHTWLTHLSHSFPVHEVFSKDLRRICEERNIHSEVLPAYDGLVIEG